MSHLWDSMMACRPVNREAGEGVEGESWAREVLLDSQTHARNRAIRAAHADGATIGAIGAACGLRGARHGDCERG